MGHVAEHGTAAVDLYWLPLGAGGRSVRPNGRLFEAVAAGVGRRPARDLYHSALEVRLGPERFVIEQTPVPDEHKSRRGVVAGGAVGSRRAGRWRVFRYEIRCWPGGQIPDVAEAVDSPRRLTSDAAAARRVLAQITLVPTPVWGRDELATGDPPRARSRSTVAARGPGSPRGRSRPPASSMMAPWIVIHGPRSRVRAS